jgi:hypothetical protein
MLPPALFPAGSGAIVAATREGVQRLREEHNGGEPFTSDTKPVESIQKLLIRAEKAEAEVRLLKALLPDGNVSVSAARVTEYKESIEELKAEIERLKEELEVQHARTADQFDRAEKAEAIMDAAREGES